MTYEEKGTWVYLVASAAGYAVYLAVVLARAGNTPLASVPYVATLLWTVGASIVASVIGRTLVETLAPSETRRRDIRDRDIGRFGEYTSRWLIIAGAVAALLMAMARWDPFWIANVIYLGFVASAVAGSAVKLVAYRRGL